MYQVNVKSTHTQSNKGSDFKVTVDSDEISVDDKLFDWDMIAVKENYYHIIKDNISYSVELVAADFETKKLTIKVNGEKFEVAAKDKFDILLKKLGMNNKASTQLKELKAPMPGLIMELKVTEGQEVKKGDTLLILEAMKMENIIKSPGDGTVKSIKVRQGDSVEKNSVLILF